MRYYSEDDVMDLIREAEDCERAYEWGEGHRRIHFEDYHPIEIPDKHGMLGDLDALAEHIKDVYCKGCKRSKVMCKACKYGDILDEIEDAFTIIEASKGRE